MQPHCRYCFFFLLSSSSSFILRLLLLCYPHLLAFFMRHLSTLYLFYSAAWKMQTATRANTRRAYLFSTWHLGRVPS